MELKLIVAHNLTELRKKNGLTQMELADKIHYSDKAISKWERGESIPEIETLLVLSEIFGVSIDMILKEDGVKEYKKSKSEKAVIINRHIITASAVVIVWILASVIFAYGYIFLKPTIYLWQAFIWAIPTSFLVLIFFNRRWGSKLLHAIYWSLLLWTLITSIVISTISYNTWFFFIIALPLQLLIILLSCLKK